MITPLEIHHINVSQGDSTLIIFRDLNKLQALVKAAHLDSSNVEECLPIAIANHVPLADSILSAVLIDGGDNEFCGDIKTYLSAQGLDGSAAAKNSVFSVVLTHRHADHMDGIRGIYWDPSTDASLRAVTSSGGKTIYFSPFFPPANVYDDGGEPKGGPPSSGSDNTYEEDIDYLSKQALTTRNTIAPGNTINMGDYTAPSGATVSISLKCVYANGSMLMNAAGGIDTPPNLANEFKKKDQNALSVCLVLEFGRFRYFLGGDIGGKGDADGGNKEECGYTPRMSFSIHPDIESSLGLALRDIYPYTSGTPHPWDGHMCGFKANHHGSGSSNDIHFLSTLTPALAVISSGIRLEFHNHPTQEVLNRFECPDWDWIDKNKDKNKSKNVLSVKNSIQGYYITEMASRIKDTKFKRKFSKGKILGDIIVRPDATSIDKPGIPIPIQVYGTGEQTDPHSTRKIRPCYDGAKTPPYPIGPFIHHCTNH